MTQTKNLKITCKTTKSDYVFSRTFLIIRSSRAHTRKKYTFLNMKGENKRDVACAGCSTAFMPLSDNIRASVAHRMRQVQFVAIGKCYVQILFACACVCFQTRRKKKKTSGENNKVHLRFSARKYNPGGLRAWLLKRAKI